MYIVVSENEVWSVCENVCEGEQVYVCPKVHVSALYVDRVWGSMCESLST